MSNNNNANSNYRYLYTCNTILQILLLKKRVIQRSRPPLTKQLRKIKCYLLQTQVVRLSSDLKYAFFSSVCLSLFDCPLNPITLDDVPTVVVLVFIW